MANAVDALTVAAKVIATLSVPFELDGISARIGSSVGIAVFPGNGRTAEELLCAADHAMYTAKQAGKGRYVIAPHPADADGIVSVG